MTQLDRIMDYVDAINTRSSQILDTMDLAALVMARIQMYHDSIADYDHDIDDIRDVLLDNVTSIHQLNQLYEKCYLLEANLASNDGFTNHTTFEHLTTEFQYVVKGLARNDAYDATATATNQRLIYQHNELDSPLLHQQSQQTDQYVDDSSSHTLHDSLAEDINVVSAKLSMLNLKLKPIKCHNTKVNKKKSKYRLLSIYTLNPFAVPLDVTTPVIDNMAQFKPNPDLDDLQTPDITQNEFPAPEDEVGEEDEDDIEDDIEEDDGIVYGVVQDTSPMFKRTIRGGGKLLLHKAASLPDILFDQPYLTDDHYEQEPPTTQRDFQRRLAHFISCNALPDMPQSSPGGLNHEPQFTAYDDSDIESISSDDTFGQAPTSASSLTNLDEYLRKLRVDINDVAPELPTKTSLHDLFLDKRTVTVSALVYHTPTIMCNTAPIVEPSAVCASFSGNTNGFGSSKQLLSSMINRQPAPKRLLAVVSTSVGQLAPVAMAGPRPVLSPLHISLLISNFWNSLLASPSSLPTKRKRRSPPPPSQNPPRLNPADDLTNSFLELMRRSKEKQAQPPPPPDRLRQIQSQPRHGPIKPVNPLSEKRRPIRIPGAIPGARSLLIIGERGALINHGESLIFHRPRMSQVRQRALSEALSQSLQ